MTSEELDEVRSVGTSLEAGVTLAILGLSLLNRFRMGSGEKLYRGKREEMRLVNEERNENENCSDVGSPGRDC